jgi:predicted small integral membrane protein
VIDPKYSSIPPPRHGPPPQRVVSFNTIHHRLLPGMARSRVRPDVSDRITLHDRTPTRGVRPVVVLLVCAAAALGIVALATLDTSALCLLPALALAAPLLLRRYPGERALADLSAVARPRRLRPRASVPHTGRLLTVAPHGGLLIARALAVRPPPALIPAS